MAQIAYRANYVAQGRLIRAIWLPVQIALVILVSLLLAGVPAVVAAGAFVLALYLAIRAAIYRAEFILDDEGITEALIPYADTWTWRKPVTRRFAWDQVVDWSLDEDLTRGLEMRKRLIIRFREPGYTIRLDETGDDAQRAAYASFVNGFLQRAAGGTLLPLEELPSRIPVEVVRERVAWPDRPGALPRRRAFMETVAGKATGLGLLALVAATTVALFHFGGSFSSWFRLVFVLIPGAAYLIWRLYLRR